jgi:hypothetical protein
VFARLTHPQIRPEKLLVIALKVENVLLSLFRARGRRDARGPNDARAEEQKRRGFGQILD